MNYTSFAVSLLANKIGGREGALVLNIGRKKGGVLIRRGCMFRGGRAGIQGFTVLYMSNISTGKEDYLEVKKCLGPVFAQVDDLQQNGIEVVVLRHFFRNNEI